MEKIIVSACLLGEACRYDGKSKPCEKVIALAEKYELIPVCPEVFGGLSTPRPPSEMQADGRFINSSGEDVTENYRTGAKSTLRIALQNGCKLAVLKEKSPSCGVHCRYDGSFTRTLIPESGITASLLRENGMTVVSEDDI